MRTGIGSSKMVLSYLVYSVLLVGLAGARSTRAQERGGVWASDIHDVSDGVIGNGPPAISIVGTRNGSFSGKVVVSGTVTKVAVSDLKQGAAIITASAIRVRYATPWGNRGNTNIRPTGNDILLEAPPAESSAGKMPVWVTVTVPKDAKAGVYAGQLSVGGVVIPIKLDVRDWTLPDPQDYRTWVELVQSPDTLAVEYDVPLWSEKHWALIAKSLQLMADTGSRVIFIPLIARTNYGNSESMVRWIKKGENKYEYDFSIVDKYLDMVEKNLGKPKLTQVYAWEVYLKPPRGMNEKWWKKAGVDPNEPHASSAEIRASHVGKGPPVTVVVDPASGKTETVYTPRYEDPAGKALWKPVFDGLRSRMKKRGLEQTLMVGMVSDECPSAEEVSALKELSGGMPWTCCAHHLNTIVPGKTLGDLYQGAPFGYAAVALDFYLNFNPAKGGQHYGWNQPFSVQYWRFQFFNAVLPYDSYVEIHYAAEFQITGSKRGIGHIGADFWPCIKNKKGEYQIWVNERFPESFWHNLQIMSWILAPGPNGAVGTTRLEVVREGIQECEGRIAIESALMKEELKAKLGADLAKRAQDYLDERLVSAWKGMGVSETDLQQLGLVTEYRKWYYEISKRMDIRAGLKWYLGSGWQDRTAKLFDLAGEVERKLAGK